MFVSIVKSANLTKINVDIVTYLWCRVSDTHYIVYIYYVCCATLVGYICRGVIMEELINENKLKTIESAKYLIQMYMSTKYRCNRQKLQKLILFAHFALLLDGKTGLIYPEVETITASYIGLGINTISKAFYALEFNGIDEETTLCNIVKKPETFFTEAYRYDKEIIVEALDYLTRMFLQFGAYSSDILSKATTKLGLYPRDVNFLQYPAGIYNIPIEIANVYVQELCKFKGTNGSDGCTIVITEVQKAITEVQQENEW